MDLVMGEILRFKHIQDCIGAIQKICHASFSAEVCGFVGFDHELNEYLVKEEDNISSDPKSYFLINPLSYLLFKDKYSMVAVFHSHLIGDEKESEFDVKMSEGCCQPFLIYSLNSKKINIYTPQNPEGDVKVLERFKAAI